MPIYCGIKFPWTWILVQSTGTYSTDISMPNIKKITIVLQLFGVWTQNMWTVNGERTQTANGAQSERWTHDGRKMNYLFVNPFEFSNTLMLPRWIKAIIQFCNDNFRH